MSDEKKSPENRPREISPRYVLFKPTKATYSVEILPNIPEHLRSSIYHGNVVILERHFRYPNARKQSCFWILWRVGPSLYFFKSHPPFHSFAQLWIKLPKNGKRITCLHALAEPMFAFYMWAQVNPQLSLSFHPETVQPWLPPPKNPLLLRPQSIDITSKCSWVLEVKTPAPFLRIIYS